MQEETSGGFDEIEYHVLRILAESDGPVGCARLRLALRSVGWPVSEAKSGRLLRHLDESGFTRTVATKGGRVLLPAGRARLRDLERLRTTRKRHGEILRTVALKDLTSLRDLLVARRALERETARLAATRASVLELDQLEALVARHNAALANGEATELSLGIEIHGMVARLAGNRMIASMLDLILHQVSLWDLEAAILRVRRATSPRDHYQLLAALRRHDSGAAEAAMVAHLDRILDEVVHYADSQHPFDLGQSAPEVRMTAQAKIAGQAESESKGIQRAVGGEGTR